MKIGSKVIAILTVVFMLFGNLVITPPAAACNESDAGKIKIHKVDSADATKNLEHAKFQIQVKGSDNNWSNITSANGSSQGVIETGADGYATSGWLYPGTYRVKEIEAPTGYSIVNEYSDSIVITRGDYGKTICLGYNLTNTKKECKGKVIISKKVLEGLGGYTGGQTFKFKITNTADKSIYFVGSVTGETSCTIENVPYGTYTLEETDVPDGFKFNSFRLNGNVVTQITVNECTNEVSVVCKNNARANIRITKDDGHGNMLSGAKFKLLRYDEHSGWVQEGAILTSNANGECSVTDLPYGTYKVEEVSAPFGYEDSTANPGEKALNVINETETFAFHNCPKVGKITVRKSVDKLDDGEAIPSFKVTLVGPKDNDNVPKKTETYSISAGDNTIDNLAFGTYDISEVEIPDGYAKNYTISAKSFKIDDTHQDNIIIGIANTKLYGSAEFTKDVDNAESDGTQFKLQVDKDGKFYAYVIVSENGGIEKLDNLPFGKYTVKEIEVDGNYEPNGITPDSFEINYDTYSAAVKVQAKNSLKLGSVKFLKEVDNVKEDATVFKLDIKLNGAPYATVEVSETKPAELNNLPLGTYTVTEQDADLYDKRGVTPNEFTVTATNYATQVVVTAKNHRQLGSVEFIKDVDNVSDDATEFTLTIKKDGQDFKTVKVSEMKSARLDGLELGTYTVEETGVPDGYEKVKLEIDGEQKDSFTVTSSNYAAKVTVKATNHKQLGSVEFIKDVDNVGGDPTKFTLNILKDGKFYAKVEATELKAGTLSGLELGNYTVEEVGAPGYDNTSLEPKSFSITATNYTTVVKVKAVNHKLFGTVTVKKVVSNVDGDETRFTVRIAGSGTAAGYLSDVTVNENGVIASTMPLNELPLGHYKVTEEYTGTAYSKDGVQIQIGSQPVITTGEFDLTAGNHTAAITITANNTKRFGRVTVKKDVTNVDGDETQFTVRIVGSGAAAGYSSDVTVNEKGVLASTMPLDRLPIGPYTVTEVNVDNRYVKDGLSVVIGSQTFTDGRFELTPENYTAEIKITARNTKKFGAVTVKKNVSNVDLDDTAFTVNIKGSGTAAGYESNVTVSEKRGVIASSKPLTGMPLGDYAVTEVNVDGTYVHDNITIQIGTAPAAVTNSFSLTPENYNAAIEITANNTKKVGAVTVKKAVSNVTDDDTPFTVNIKGSGTAAGYESNVTVSEKRGVIASSKPLTGMPLGSYTVSEINVDGGYSHDNITIQIGTGPANVTNTFSLTAGNFDAAIVITANNTKRFGKVTVKKDVSNVDGDDRRFTVRITGSGTAAGYESAVTVSETEGVVSSTKALNELPLGHYTVTEDSPGDEYSRDSIGIKIGNAPESLTGEFDLTTDNYTAAITITANNTKKLGAAEFYKAVDNIDKDGAKFTLKVMKDGAFYANVEVSEAGGVQKLNDLTFGTYTVTEEYTGSEYTPKGIAITQDGNAVPGNSFVIGPDTYSAAVKVTATNHKNLGSVTLQKAVDNATGDETKFGINIKGTNFDHTVSLSQKDGVVDGGDYSFLTDIPFGEYTVSEVIPLPAGYDKVKITVDGVETDKLNINADTYSSTIAIVVTNHKRLGKVSVQKVMDNTVNDETDFAITIEGEGYKQTVTLSQKDGVINGAMAGYEFLNGLPYGTYTVSEANSNSEYEPVDIRINGEKTNTFTIGDGTWQSTIAIAATNHRRYGQAIFSKSIDNATGDATFFKLVVNKDGKFYANVLVSQSGAAVPLNDLPFGTYTVTEEPSTEYERVDIVNGTFVIGEKTFAQPVYVEAKNHKKLGSASFGKAVDNVPNDPTEFTLFVDGIDVAYHGEVKVGGGITGASLWNLPFGHYKVTEKPTDNYVTVKIEPDTFEINESNYKPEMEYMTSVTVSATNHKLLGRIQVIKQDSANPSLFLKDAEFKISTSKTDFDAGVVDTLTTAADGTATSKELEAGTYWVKETKAPGGYVIDNANAVEVTLPYNATLKLPAFKDTKDEGSLLIHKVSTLDGKPVKGVQFEVSTRSDFAAGSLLALPNGGKTDENGELLVEHLATGLKLWVREIHQAPGYDIDPSAVRNVTVVFNQTVRAEFANNPVGKVRVTKVDAADITAKLSGAVFGVYSDEACTKLVETLAATDAGGIATSGELPFGANTVYYVKEITAPAGYLLSTEVKQAKFTEPGQVVELTFADTKTTGSLMILKVDSLDETKKLAGATFQLYADESLKTKVDAAVTTGVDGLARWSGLEAGDYWLVETAAPKNYELLTAAVPVTVTAGVTEPEAYTLTNTYNPPEDIQTGMMDWNILLIGGLALLAGAVLVVLSRRQKAKGRK